jgi:hydrogenase nickel incorporation protein HypA/HybF
MHEISIAESILEIAQAEAFRRNALSVQRIKLQLGEFTTIVNEALKFAFEVVRHGTIASEAVLEIETVPTIVECVICCAITIPEKTLSLVCSQCGFPLRIISGEELRIEYIEIETQDERSQWNESLCKQMSSMPTS